MAQDQPDLLAAGRRSKWRADRTDQAADAADARRPHRTLRPGRAQEVPDRRRATTGADPRDSSGRRGGVVTESRQEGVVTESRQEGVVTESRQGGTAMGQKVTLKVWRGDA